MTTMSELPTIAEDSVEFNILRAIIFKKLYPRVYQNIGQFNSPKNLAEVLSYALAKQDLPPELEVPLGYMVTKGMPYFFVCKEFSEAIKRTDFTESIDWLKLKLPFEHGGFVFPVGDTFDFILWSRVLPSEYSSVIAQRKLVCNFTCFMLCGRTHNGNWYMANIKEHTNPVSITLRELSQEMEVLIGNHTVNLTPEQMIEMNLGRDMYIELGRIAFGILMALYARPNLLEPQRREKTIVEGNGTRKEFWTPNLIGKYFRYRKVSESSDGSHSSPRTHWRRGHFRNQAYGTGRHEHKTIWIEPVLVNVQTA